MISLPRNNTCKNEMSYELIVKSMYMYMYPKETSLSYASLEWVDSSPVETWSCGLANYCLWLWIRGSSDLVDRHQSKSW